MISLKSETIYELSDTLLKEEEYNKKIYKLYNDCDWSLPMEVEEFEKIITQEDSPYAHDKVWSVAHPNNDILSDNILDYYQTDIYAMIPPNYLPLLSHSHTFFELVYIAEGSCINYSGNQKLELQKGDLLILAPNTRHAISAFSDECRIINVMIRSMTFTDTFFHDFDQEDILYSFFHNVLFQYKTNTYILFRTKNDSIIQSVMFSLLEEKSPYHRYHDKTKTASLSLIFSRLIDLHAVSAVVYGDDTSDKVHAIAMILNYMQQHYQHLTITELSGFFGYSERHMSRVLKKFTGKNFRENLTCIKMRYAAVYLKDRNNSVDQIADYLGYSTAYSFRESFKRAYKCTPQEYREGTTETDL